MGSLGVPEMVFIFVLALLLFGPKKLPEVGRTIGKAMAEFRRASSELKATFDREMKTLERETESIKEVANDYHNDTYNYDYSSYDSGYYGSESQDSTATEVSTTSASATQGAESHTAANPPEGTVAHGTETAAVEHSAVEGAGNGSAAEHAAEHAGVTTTSGEHALYGEHRSPEATEHKA
jgi:sec-independent protein translocase protein TatA